MIVQFSNEKVSNHGSIPITIDCNVVAFIVFEEISFTPNAAVLFVHVAIQPEVHFIAKQNSLMKSSKIGRPDWTISEPAAAVISEKSYLKCDATRLSFE
ncbi:hypothetical protein TNCV_4334571 [Trichonephila clavipes]|nr:hypothetical protein TNCV_4334571 [Trichonephila clavipes]